MPSTAFDPQSLYGLAATLLLAIGLGLLRSSWSHRGGRSLHRLAGWLAVVLGVGTFVQGFGGEVGTTYALLGLSIVAFAVIAIGLERRAARGRPQREIALEPEDRPTNWPRAISKSLLAIVLAGVASIGLGVAFAVAMPLAPTDRIVLGGLLVPVLWGAGMAWTLCDARLVRATILLLIVSAVGYGIAFLPKVLS